ncbi:phage baseplate protein [Xenorhabdus stockiae]|uniref:phage baseplate protein n=1 Tax=Xenorhabdus stockiae TaxID=351614 RepID=UPI003CFA0954
MDILSTLFFQNTRRIGMIIPSVVISEKHQDSAEITEHPVQYGAAISDHAYDKPSEVTMELGFAGGGSLIDGFDTPTKIFDFNTEEILGRSPKEIYEQLLKLKASKEPFDVLTGKRRYRNMLIRAIEVVTDKTSENVLMVTLTLREVIIVDTAIVEGIKVPRVARTAPLEAQPTLDRGTVTPITIDKNQSLLNAGYEALDDFLGGALSRLGKQITGG